jgi:hypothetical protein
MAGALASQLAEGDVAQGDVDPLQQLFVGPRIAVAPGAEQSRDLGDLVLRGHPRKSTPASRLFAGAMALLRRACA